MALKPEEITAICDTREQNPLDLSPLTVVTGSLPTGDYTILGLESVISIERKSLPDLLACVGRERNRFDAEIQRLLAYPTRAVVVESSWVDLEAGQWRSKVTASAAIGSCLGWIAAGVPIVMCDNHERCGRFVARLLFTSARRRYRENKSFTCSLQSKKEPQN